MKKNTLIKKEQKKVKIVRWLVIIILYLCVLTDIFFLSGSSDKRYYSVFILYTASALFMRITSKITIIFCLLLLLIMFIRYLLVGPDAITEKIAVWMVLLFITSVIQQVKE